MKWMISILVSLLGIGCVTSGEEPLAMIGVVAVYSNVAAHSQQGDKSAQKLWCDALHAVDRKLHDTPHQEIAPQERQSLVLKVEEMARGQGFRLHAMQINKLIDDAVIVLGHKDSRTSELSKCDADERK